MTRTNRVAAACGVMLIASIANQLNFDKSDAPAATIIEPAPTPEPELAEVSPPPPAEPKGTAKGHEAPAVEWLTWPEASALSKQTGRPVLVLQKFRDPAADKACLPCQRLKKTLADDKTLEAFAELGIPCIGYAEDWQKGTIQAPAIGYVAPGKTGDAPLFIDFRVAPADAFLTDLKAWIDNVQK